MENSHRAMSDVNALYSIFRSELFWNNRKESLQTSIVDGGPGLILLPNHDSDVSDSSDSEDGDNGTRKRHRDEDDTNISDNEDESNEQAPAGDYWRKIDFVPLENPAEKFNAAFTSSCRSGANRTGLQVSPAMANSPIKAWRLIFTASILDNRNAKDWSPITRRDMTDFFAVLFVMSVQKRKDKPSNWFSDNPLLESKVAKKITTGRQFGKMLRYLHCCDPDVGG
jgi:hypothetical protein